jgi:hypothetical protein
MNLFFVYQNTQACLQQGSGDYIYIACDDKHNPLIHIGAADRAFSQLSLSFLVILNMMLSVIIATNLYGIAFQHKTSH